MAVWHSLWSTGSPGEIPGHLYQPMSRGRGKHLCRICKQNQSWLSVDAESDSGILGREAGEDVNNISSRSLLSRPSLPRSLFSGKCSLVFSGALQKGPPAKWMISCSTAWKVLLRSLSSPLPSMSAYGYRSSPRHTSGMWRRACSCRLSSR